MPGPRRSTGQSDAWPKRRRAKPTGGRRKKNRAEDEDEGEDKDEGEDEEMGGGFVVTPAQQKHLRACMVCSFVQLHSRFLSEGCPNCEPHLGMVGAPEVVEECTSPVYEGLISLVDPMNSWVAKWNRLEGFAPGVYAVKVVGMLSDDRLMQLEENGVRYFPRDGSGNSTTD